MHPDHEASETFALPVLIALLESSAFSESLCLSRLCLSFSVFLPLFQGTVLKVRTHYLPGTYLHVLGNTLSKYKMIHQRPFPIIFFRGSKP